MTPAHSALTAECSSELYTEPSGYITSLEYPRPYPPDLRCNYSIRVERGLTLHLKFLEPFEIDDHQQVHCPYDQLQVQPSYSLRLSFLPTPIPASRWILWPTGTGMTNVAHGLGKWVLGIPLLLQLKTHAQSRVPTTTTILARWDNV